MKSTNIVCKKWPSRASKIVQTVVTSAELNAADEKSLRSTFKSMAKSWKKKRELEIEIGKEIRIVPQKQTFYKTMIQSLKNFMSYCDNPVMENETIEDFLFLYNIA